MSTRHFSIAALCKKNINNIINKARKTAIKCLCTWNKEHLEELSRFSAVSRTDSTNMIKMFSASRLEMPIYVTETA